MYKNYTVKIHCFNFFPSLCIHTPSHKQNIICHQQPRRPQFRMTTKPQFYMILKLWTFLLLLFVSECWLLEPLLFPLEAEIKIANLSDIYQKHSHLYKVDK